MAATAPPAQARLDAFAVGIMLLLCAVWGVQQVASKVALGQGMPPIMQAVLRSAVAGPLLIGWVAFRRGLPGLRALVARDGTLGPGLLTALLFAAEFILLFTGVQRTSASHAIVLLFSGAFFTAAGAHLLLPAERLRPVHAAGLVLAFLGVAATMQGGSGGGATLAGDALVLGAAATWGATTLAVKSSPALLAASSEKVLAYQLLGALPILVAAAMLAGEWRVLHASALAWAALAYQCVVVAFASYLTWFFLVARYPATRLAAFSFLSPLLGVVAAWALLDEPLTPMLVVGLACVGTGLRMVNSR